MFAIAWVFTNPPGSAPDEQDHYVKALGVGYGQLLGKPGPLPKDAAALRGITGSAYDWSSLGTRWVRVRAGMVPAGLGCNVFHPEISSQCLLSATQEPSAPDQFTDNGTYQPFTYLVPGLMTRLTDDATTALLLARLGNAATSVGLIALAAWLLAVRQGPAAALLGLVLAVRWRSSFSRPASLPTDPKFAPLSAFLPRSFGCRDQFHATGGCGPDLP